MADGAVPGLTFGPRRPWGLAWIAHEPRFMRRASCALVDDGRVWLVDPVDGPGLDTTLAGLGTVVGIVRLLDRHARDSEPLARRFGVPVHADPVDGVPGAPFDIVSLGRGRMWREAALWWPAHRLLVVPESLGTAPYFRVPGARLGVHPVRRLTPPRALLGLRPGTLVVGHGAPLEGPGVADDVRDAITNSRRETPRWLLNLPRALRRPRG